MGEIECTVNNAFKEFVVRNEVDKTMESFINQFVIPRNAIIG